MSADLVVWLPFAIKLVLTAAIVVTASMVAERAGPLTGAMVATLPVTIWPAYVFLALDHDAGYLAQAARSGLAVNAVTGVFMLVYAALAQRRGLILSVAGAVGSWIALAFAVRSVEWTLGAALLANLVVYPTAIWLARRFAVAQMPPLRRRWYDLPLRTLLVCALMATILEASQWAGPLVTGMLAVYPISSTSLMLILHRRIGGRASGAVIANSLWGLIGIAISLLALHLTAVPFGAAPALALALLIPMVWNFSVWTTRRRLAAASA